MNGVTILVNQPHAWQSREYMHNDSSASFRFHKWLHIDVSLRTLMYQPHAWQSREYMHNDSSASFRFHKWLHIDVSLRTLMYWSSWWTKWLYLFTSSSCSAEKRSIDIREGVSSGERTFNVWLVSTSTYRMRLHHTHPCQSFIVSAVG